MNHAIAGMPPLWKLQRLKELHRAIMNAPPMPVDKIMSSDLWPLMVERDEILATIGAVPVELMATAEPATWAATFSATFPQVDASQVAQWFANAMLVAATAGHDEGLGAGKAHARSALGFDELVACLRLVRDGIKAGRIQSAKVNDTTDPSKPARPLVELIVETLAGVGVTS